MFLLPTDNLTLLEFMSEYIAVVAFGGRCKFYIACQFWQEEQPPYAPHPSEWGCAATTIQEHLIQVAQSPIPPKKVQKKITGIQEVSWHIQAHYQLALKVIQRRSFF